MTISHTGKSLGRTSVRIRGFHQFTTSNQNGIVRRWCRCLCQNLGYTWIYLDIWYMIYDIYTRIWNTLLVDVLVHHSTSDTGISSKETLQSPGNFQSLGRHFGRLSSRHHVVPKHLGSLPERSIVASWHRRGCRLRGPPKQRELAWSEAPQKSGWNLWFMVDITN